MHYIANCRRFSVIFSIRSVKLHRYPSEMGCLASMLWSPHWHWHPAVVKHTKIWQTWRNNFSGLRSGKHSMKLTVTLLAFLLAMLSYRLLFGDGSVQELSRLNEDLRNARSELVSLQNRNQSLRAEVDDLQNGLDAVEERARLELGMIGNDETFYQFIGGDGESGAVSGGANGPVVSR